MPAPVPDSTLATLERLQAQLPPHLARRDLAELAVLMRYAERGAWAFAVYNTVPVRDEVAGVLRELLAPLPVYEFTLSSQRANPLDYLNDIPADQERAVAFFFDLEQADTTWYDFGEVTTHTLVGNSGEVHVFWHNSARAAYLYLGGYGISVPHGETLGNKRRDGCLIIRGGGNHSMIKVLQAPPGELEFELLAPRTGWQHSHNFGGRGAFPHWQSRSPVPSNTPVAIYVDGTRDRKPVDPIISLSCDNGFLRVTFEGETHLIQLPY